jgi:hypothetical protein
MNELSGDLVAVSTFIFAGLYLIYSQLRKITGLLGVIAERLAARHDEEIEKKARIQVSEHLDRYDAARAR